ncbi:MAG: DUF2232 domain-containing protein [Gammaproteobacteria bacterium]|nr:DUF2232 domain-containing protein [Gammaproteobacteria bacterium]
MQPLVAWLVARPQNAVIALAATLLLPVLQVFSGIFMVILILKQGLRPALFAGAIAAALLAIVSLIASAPVVQVALSVLTVWVPAALLAVTVRSTRSLNLTMQVSALIAAAAVLFFHGIVDDLVDFWQPVMAFMIDWARESRLDDQVALIEAQPALVAHTLTIVLVLSSWSMYALYLLFGVRYAAAQPEETGKYGRFCDLNFGRVIALLVAFAALLAFASGMAWLQSVAIVLFAIFWLQGLAVVHWMFVDGKLPLFVVIVTYVLMPFLHVFMFLALGVVGYTDAWFRYRRRAAAQS